MPDRAGQYEIVIRGPLSARLEAALTDFALEPRPGATALKGHFPDHAQLRALLDRLADSGFEVVSVDAVG